MLHNELFFMKGGDDMNHLFNLLVWTSSTTLATTSFLLVLAVPITVALVYVVLSWLVENKPKRIFLSYVFTNFIFSIVYIFLSCMKESEVKTLISSGYVIASTFTIQGLFDLLILSISLSMNIWAHVVYVVIVIVGIVGIRYFKNH